MKISILSPILFLSLLALIAQTPGCTGGPKEIALEVSSPGKTTFTKYCQTCHRLPNPSIKTDKEWPYFVARYGERAKLDSAQQNLILSYLISAN